MAAGVDVVFHPAAAFVEKTRKDLNGLPIVLVEVRLLAVIELLAGFQLHLAPDGGRGTAADQEKVLSIAKKSAFTVCRADNVSDFLQTVRRPGIAG